MVATSCRVEYITWWKVQKHID